jgi:hypothetical protein
MCSARARVRLGPEADIGAPLQSGALLPRYELVRGPIQRRMETWTTLGARVLREALFMTLVATIEFPVRAARAVVTIAPLLAH